MARTTGFTCTSGANLILKNLFNQKGVFPPEIIGQHKDCYEYIIKYLNLRNVNLKFQTKKI